MEFCPKCGALMVPKQGKKRKSLACDCGYRTKQKPSVTSLKEKVPIGRGIEVVDKKLELLPKTDEECPKCKNKEAYYWTVQTRAGDEAETRFLECTKCKHRWRSNT